MIVNTKNHREALHLLTDGLCRIREAAVEAPEHAMQMADTLHNIPGILAGENRADEAYFSELLAKGRSLMDDHSWRDMRFQRAKKQKSALMVGGFLVVIAIGWLGGLVAINFASETVRSSCIDELHRLAASSDSQDAALASAVLAKRPCDKL